MVVFFDLRLSMSVKDTSDYLDYPVNSGPPCDELLPSEQGYLEQERPETLINKISMRQQQCYYQDDPGLIFDIKSPGDMHFCLGLPTTNTVRPQLRQGTSVNKSVQNLYNWLDRLILQFCTNNVFVYNSSGGRKYGWY